jgi:hypothetical protein
MGDRLVVAHVERAADEGELETRLEPASPGGELESAVELAFGRDVETSADVVEPDDGRGT